MILRKISRSPEGYERKPTPEDAWAAVLVVSAILIGIFAYCFVQWVGR